MQANLHNQHIIILMGLDCHSFKEKLILVICILISRYIVQNQSKLQRRMMFYYLYEHLLAQLTYHQVEFVLDGVYQQFVRIKE